MQPGSLRESQVFLSLINLWATEVIPNPYFIWLLSHKSFWGETGVQEQPWQFLWRNFIRLLIRLAIPCRREAWLGELMGHIPQKTKGARQSYAGCWGERSGLHPLWHSKGSGSPWGLLLLKACKVTGGTTLRDRDRVTPRQTGLPPSEWDRRAIHTFCIALFSPSHESNIIWGFPWFIVKFGAEGAVTNLTLWHCFDFYRNKEIVKKKHNCFQCSSYGKIGSRMRQIKFIWQIKGYFYESVQKNLLCKQDNLKMTMLGITA